MMPPVSSAPAATAAIPHCAVHPEVPARRICERCGSFCCGLCVTRVLGRSYCAACAALPEVNYLEALRVRLWGRRDASAWMLGAWGLAGLGLGVAMCREGEWKAGAVALAQAVVWLGCFFRQRWARWSLLGWPSALGGWLVVTGGLPRAIPALLLLALGGAVFTDARHQLFFRVPVPERMLSRLWERYENNPLARSALAFGVLGLALPVLAPLALGVGAVALRRVDPEAHPPIGRKGQAVGAMVLGMGSMLLWAGFLWPRFLEGLQALG